MVKILSENLECVETIKEYTSVIFNLKFTNYGDFTLTLPPLYNSSHIIKNNYVVHKENVGIIKYISKTNTAVIVRGFCVKSLLKQRVCCDFYSGPVETVAKTIVGENTLGNRCFIGLQIAEDKQRGENITYDATGETVADALHNICTKYNYGWEIKLIGKQLIFDLVEPQDRDTYYSVRHGNVSGYEYTLDALSEVNTAQDQFIDKGIELYLEPTYEGYSVYVSPGQILLDDKKTVFRLTSSKYLCEFREGKIFYAYKNDGGGIDIAVFDGENTTCPYPISRKIGYINDSDYGNFKLYNTKVNTTHIFSYNDNNTGLSRVETYKSNRFEIAEESEKRLEKVVETATAFIISYADYNTKWKLGDTVKLRIDIYGMTYIFTKQITEIQIVEEAYGQRILPVFGETKNLLKKLLKQRGV